MPSVSTGKLLADRYRVVGRLGAGGMAVVVLAQDERLGRRVAVKRLHAGTAEGPGDTARRFEREAKLGASLNHPNIVAVYDIACDEEAVLIVMEYVDGHTLRQEMDGGPLPPARAIEVLSGVAAGLDHAHAAGVVHRDVKPANVLIAADGGRTKITDLGIATAAERTNITRSGVVLGTAAYMAPERLDGDAGGPAVDVYALAAVAFEALAGAKPITGRTAMEVAQRVVSEPPPDLAEVVPGTPARAAEALRRGLAKDPAERPASAGELVRELAAAYAEAAEEPAKPAAAPVAAPAPEPPAPPSAPRAQSPRPEPARGRDRRAWAVPAALAAAMALVAVLVIALASSGGGGDKPSDSSAAADRSSAGNSSKDGGSAGDDGSGSAPATPGSGSAAPEGTAADPSTPTGALQSLYTRAAEDDFDGAWELGTDRLHAQLRGRAGFVGTFRTLESIEFRTLRLASQSGDRAQVNLRTVARHTSYTDRCTGTADLTRRGGTWLVDHLNVGCKHS